METGEFVRHCNISSLVLNITVKCASQLKNKLDVFEKAMRKGAWLV